MISCNVNTYTGLQPRGTFFYIGLHTIILNKVLLHLNQVWLHNHTIIMCTFHCCSRCGRYYFVI